MSECPEIAAESAEKARTASLKLASEALLHEMYEQGLIRDDVSKPPVAPDKPGGEAL